MSNRESFKRFVEVGRVVLINEGESSGKLAVVVEIIDHNKVRKARVSSPFSWIHKCSPGPSLPSPLQAIIECPSTGVPRQAMRYRYLSLTPHVVPNLPRAANTATVKKYFDKSGVVEKWSESSWAKKRQTAKLRSEMSDCEWGVSE